MFLRRKRITSFLVAAVMVITMFTGNVNVSRAAEPGREMVSTEASMEVSEEITEQGTEEPDSEVIYGNVTEEAGEASGVMTEETEAATEERTAVTEEATAVQETLPAENEIQLMAVDASETDAERKENNSQKGNVLNLVERTVDMVNATGYQVISHNNITGDGASVGYFTITGVTGYAVCGNQNITGPAAGAVANNATTYTGQNYIDMFYYGYGGPGASELSINSTMGQGLVSLSKAISYLSLGDAGLSGSTEGSGMHSGAKTLYDHAVSDKNNAPSASLTFSKTSGISVSVVDNVQKTENIILSGDARMSYNIPLDIGMCLYKSDGTLVKKGGSATVYGGTEFYITAPLSKNGTWKTGTLYSNEQTIGSVIRLDFGAGAQPVWFANPVRASASLSVTFTAPCAVELTKVSANKDVTDGNGCYSLKNAVYGIYTSRADAAADAAKADGKLSANTKRIATITTNAKGYGKAENLAYPNGGKFYIKELVPPKGYSLNPAVHSVDAVAGDTVSVVRENTPQLDPAAIVVKKEGAKNISLEGAEFTVKYYDVLLSDASLNPENSGHMPERTWVFKTNEKGRAYLNEEYKVSGNDFYYMATGDTGLPIGTVTIQETKAPEGYYIDDTIYVRQITAEGNLEQINTYNAPVVTDKFIPGKIIINKTGEVKEWNEETKKFETSEKPLKDATFGIYAAEDIYVNGSDTELAYAKDAAVDTVTTDDSGRAVSTDLYAGKYILKEINVPAGYESADDVPVTISTTDSISTVEINGEQTEGYIKLVNIRNELTEVELETMAMDDATGDSQGSLSESCSITDRTKIKGLVPGREYTLMGMAVDKKTGEQIKAADVPVAAGKTFTAAADYEEIGVAYTFNSMELAGSDIVFFEYLYYDGKLIALHEDISDEGQTIHFPSIGTKAKDSVTGTRKGTISEKCTLIDTVTYDNRIPGEEYKLKTILMNKRTNKPLTDKEGNEVTAEMTFTAEAAAGQADISVTIDASELAGSDIVFFEYLYHNDILVAMHADISDEEQTITFPPNTPPTPPTGDNVNISLTVLLALLALAGMAVIFLHAKKNRE